MHVQSSWPNAPASPSRRLNPLHTQTVPVPSLRRTIRVDDRVHGPRCRMTSILLYAIFLPAVLSLSIRKSPMFRNDNSRNPLLPALSRSPAEKPVVHPFFQVLFLGGQSDAKSHTGSQRVVSTRP